MAASKNNNYFRNTSEFLTSEKFRRIMGLFFLLTSLFLIIAFLSYLFTWKADQSEIARHSISKLFTSEINVENQLGRLGAVISHIFFYQWFGISSFLFIPMTIATGVTLLLKEKTPFSLKKVYIQSLFFLFWICITAGFIFNSSGFPFGGMIGIAAAEWLKGFAGTIGSAGILFFLLASFTLLFYNIQPVKWGAFFKKKAAGSDQQNVQEGSLDETVLSSQEEEQTAEQVNEVELDSNIPDEPVKKEQKKEKNQPEDIGLDIEEGKKEAQVEHNMVNTSYDPTLDLPKYKFPDLKLLEDYGNSKVKINKNELENNKDQIIETLNNYNIKISKIKATIGPTVTLYEIIPAPGIRISKIKNLEDDIALSLAALGIRIIAPIPGRGTIGIEVPNQKKEIVGMKSVVASESFQKAKMELPVILGKTISNDILIADLASMPHLLIAGATGQGKSVGLNAILSSLLYKKHPSQLKLVLIDPKMVELSLFKRLENHFLAKLPDTEESIITDTQKVVKTLKSLVEEMDNRYRLLQKAFVKDIKAYNQKFVNRKLNPNKGHRFLPFIVLVIDEFADLIMTAGKEVEMPIARLAQKARAIGIHLVVATQRPSVNIITGTIKANFPARIAFKVTSKVDSRTILDAGGAEQLIGRGDMLLSEGGEMIRLQCPFIDTPEVEKITEFIGEQKGYPGAFLLPEIAEEDQGTSMQDLDERDDIFEEAARIVVQHQQGSTSLLQRKLKLGYNRAGRIIDQLEAANIVGPHEGSKAREVLISDEYQLEQFLNELEEQKKSA